MPVNMAGIVPQDLAVDVAAQRRDDGSLMNDGRVDKRDQRGLLGSEHTRSTTL